MRGGGYTKVPGARMDGEVIDLRETPGTRPVLIVHSSDDMYGADRMVLEVVGAMAARDRARVVVWLPADYQHGSTPLCEELASRGIAYEHLDLPIVRRRYLNPRGASAISARVAHARRRLAELDPSEVILATSAVLPLAPFIGRRGRSTVILHMQEIWAGREAHVLAAMASRVDRIVAISQASRESLPERLRDRTVVVPNGTAEPENVLPVQGRSGPLTFVVASRWNSWKGHDVLLRAWDAAGCPGTLVVLGGPPAMGASIDVTELAAGVSRPESVRILGEVTDVGAEIDAADVMIVPSTKPEPFGLVSIEAFARQRPVIASAAGGSLEIVQEGAGWLFPPGDVGALAGLLAALSRAEVEVAADAARSRYEQVYSRSSFRSAMRSALDLTTNPVPVPVIPDPRTPELDLTLRG